MDPGIIKKSGQGLLLAIAVLLVLLAVWFFTSPPSPPARSGFSGANIALHNWHRQRAYPNAELAQAGYYRAFAQLQQGGDVPGESGAAWKAIGPANIGGRTLAIAFNPLNASTIYAGSASGGLWRSYTAGVGAAAWAHVPSGFPLLGVSSIAFAPHDSMTLYIGSGEVYSYGNASGGLAVRTTRGSYGLGILKSTDGGESWFTSLDWRQFQNRGVWKVAVHPLQGNLLWAATTEGIFRSGDGGASWTVALAVPMAMDLLVNPLDSAIVFAGCGNLGSAGHGIYRSTDGGSSWSQLGNGLPATFGGKVSLAMFPSNPQIIYASIGDGSTGGTVTWLVKSTDGGDNWSVMNSSDYATYQGWYSHFVTVDPRSAERLLVGGIDIHRSFDSGRTLDQRSFWYKGYYGTVPAGGPEGPPDYAHADHHAAVFHPGNPNIAYFATDGGIFRTTDGGSSFEGCNGGYQTQQFYNGFSSSPIDSALAIGGLQDNASAIYRGSSSWLRVLGGDGGWTAMHPQNSAEMYGTYQYLAIHRSRNGGQSWRQVHPPTGPLTSFAAPFVLSPANTAILYAGRSIVYRSTDSGDSWSATNSGLPINGDPLLSMAASTTSSRVVYAGTAPINDRARIFRTLSDGAAWQDITGTLPDRFPVDLAVDPLDDAIVYAIFSGFGSGHVFRSGNFGNSWQDISGTLPDVPTSAIAIDPHFPQHLYVGNDIGVFVSTDRGSSWQEYRSGMRDAQIVMDLSISLSNRQLRAVTHGSGVFQRALLGRPAAVSAAPAPAIFSLGKNFPNPFNGQTVIPITLEREAAVDLYIYDALGREVARLLSGDRLPAGAHETAWNGEDEQGNHMPSGVYIYRVRVSRQAVSRQMLLVR